MTQDELLKELLSIDDMMARVDYLFDKSPLWTWPKDKMLLFISDLHENLRGPDDMYMVNEEILLRNLPLYDPEKTIVMIGGDQRDLLKCLYMDEIVQKNPKTESLLEKYKHAEIAGNHDQKLLTEWRPLAYKIVIPETGERLLWTHGHVVDKTSFDLWEVSQLIVRYFVASAEDVFHIRDSIDPLTLSASTNNVRHNEVVEIWKKWAVDRKTRTIIGHTHTMEQDCPASIAGDFYYNNDGCAVYPGAISVLEGVERRLTAKIWV